MKASDRDTWAGWWRPRRPAGRWQRVCTAESAAEAADTLAAVVSEPGDTAVLPAHRRPGHGRARDGGTDGRR